MLDPEENEQERAYLGEVNFAACGIPEPTEIKFSSLRYHLNSCKHRMDQRKFLCGAGK